MTGKFDKFTNFKLNDANYNPATKQYQGKVKPHYFDEFDYVFEYYDTPKTGTSQKGFEWTAVAEMQIPGIKYPVAIYEGTDKQGRKRLSGTAKDQQGNVLFYINLKPVLSASPIKSFEIAIVEMDRGVVDNVDNDVPF